MRKSENTWKSSLALFAAAFIWGTAFVAQSVGMDYLGPLAFNGARFLMGSAVLLPVICFNRTKRRREGRVPGNLKAAAAGGVCCGLVLCAAALLQQYGILETSVGKAGFITTLYIVLVPFFGVFLRRKIPGKVWAGAGIALLGMYLLCVDGGFRPAKGDVLLFACAILFSIHILVIDCFSSRADGVELSCVQFLTAGIIAGVLSFFLEKPAAGDFIDGIIPLAYAGILSSGVAYTLQVVGQKKTNPAVASLILSLESVISALAGWAVLGQKLTERELVGCGLVFCAVILVQLPKRRFIKQRFH